MKNICVNAITASTVKAIKNKILVSLAEHYHFIPGIIFYAGTLHGTMFSAYTAKPSSDCFELISL